MLEQTIHVFTLIIDMFPWHVCQRYFWKEPNPVCHCVHHSLPGSAHLLHLHLQHLHEGESPVSSPDRQYLNQSLRAVYNDMFLIFILFIYFFTR